VTLVLIQAVIINLTLGATLQRTRFDRMIDPGCHESFSAAGESRSTLIRSILSGGRQ